MEVKDFINKTRVDERYRPPFDSTTELGASNNGFAGISSFFPDRSAVVGYEDGSLDRTRLRALYPRFGRSPIIQALEGQARQITGAKYVVVLPNDAATKACVDFVSKSFPKISWSRNVRDYPGTDKRIICCDDEAVYKKSLEFWQHTGEIVTARGILPLLDTELPKGFSVRDYSQEERQHLLGKLSAVVKNIYRLTSDRGIFIANTGMSAIFHAFRAVDSLPQNQKEGTYVQFGFPYTDTFKILQKWGEKAELLSAFSDENYKRVEELAASGELKAVFTEAPCNPLICTPDLQRLSKILRKYKVPLIVDDTLASPYNIDVLPYADMLADSATKFLSGKGNVMAGILLVNQHSPMAAALTQSAKENHFDTISAADLQVLNLNARGFNSRMHSINNNAQAIAAFLREHPAVDWVGYPQGDGTERNYANLKRASGGYGGMVSMRLKRDERTEEFMQALHCWKGPSLGFERMIASLYTLFAHFTELDWAASHGIGANDIRLSVGTDSDEIGLIKSALRVA